MNIRYPVRKADGRDYNYIRMDDEKGGFVFCYCIFLCCGWYY